MSRQRTDRVSVESSILRETGCTSTMLTHQLESMRAKLPYTAFAFTRAPMPSRRLVVPILSGGVAAVVAAGCATPRTVVAPRPGAWTALACWTCERGHVAIEIQPSVDSSGVAGSHLLARIRNLNDYGVALVADFRADVVADADGYVPGEEWRVVLGAANGPDAEATILLRRTDIENASVSHVERVGAAGRLSSGRR